MISLTLGILKQPSSNGLVSPDSSIISGFINTFFKVAVLNPEDSSKSLLSNTEVSMINSRILFPICGAAKPTPLA